MSDKLLGLLSSGLECSTPSRRRRGFLAELRAMPDFVWKEGAIENAIWVVAQKRQMLRARRHVAAPTLKEVRATSDPIGMFEPGAYPSLAFQILG